MLVAVAATAALSTVGALRIVPFLLRHHRHVRPNYRGSSVIATAGIVLVVPLTVGVAWALAAAAGDAAIVWSMGGVGAAMAALGFADDVYGDRRAGGFAGHARELVHGHVTTGMVKAVGGGVVGIVAAWAAEEPGGWIVIGGAVVALSANLTNLLDLRPGRALKVWLPCAVALLIVGRSDGGTRVLAALCAGAVVFGVAELRERVMLGDTGAGLLGGVIGVAAISGLGRPGLVAVLAVLLALTVASEVVSFSRVIEAVPPLRWADRLGRRD